MREVVIFVGPSLEREAICRIVPATVTNLIILPPARQGDFLRILSQRPKAIGLIDGFFFQQPAIHYKEIILAIEDGIEVIGASSMGALRAAELNLYGMEGIGEIFRMYANGELEGDDEVAVLHAGANENFRRLSDALVNIRITVGLALRRRILNRKTANAILTVAKRLHFSQRTYAEITSVVERSSTLRFDPLRLAQFRDFVQTSHIDQKRLDAMALIETLVNRIASGTLRDARPIVKVPMTIFLRGFERQYRGRLYGEEHIADHRIWSLQKLLEPGFEARWQRLAIRCLAIDEARERGLHPPTTQQLIDDFQMSNDLSSDSELTEWLERHHMDCSELIDWLQDCRLEMAMRAEYNDANGSGTEFEYDKWVLTTVAGRLGLAVEEVLDKITARLENVLDEPMIREEKATGNFADAVRRAHEVMNCNRSYERDAPDVIGRLADIGLERWFATRWAVPLTQIGTAIRKRGFTNLTSFYDTARMGFLFDALGERPSER